MQGRHNNIWLYSQPYHQETKNVPIVQLICKELVT